jgi:ubiquinone/menaquinone biosynthesis C-methylase UbiE
MSRADQDAGSSTTPSDQKKAVADFFSGSEGWQGKYYDTADSSFGRMLQRREMYVLDLVRRHFARGQGAVLDVGCGSGVYLVPLAELGFDVKGIDLSPGMLDACRERVAASQPSKPVELKLGDIENIPFASGSFRAVICIGVLGYLINDEKGIAELHRVLEKGGTLFISVRNGYTPINTVMMGFRSIKSMIAGGKERGLVRDPRRGVVSSRWTVEDRGYQNKAYDLKIFEQTMRENGFERQEALTFGFPMKPFRKLGWIPEPIFSAVELTTERLTQRLPWSSLTRMGWGYVGVFTKR